MTTEQHINLGRHTAIISYLLGTGIFGLYCLTCSFGLLITGYGLILFTRLVNLGVLISIIAKGRVEKYNKIKVFTTCGLMLLNIPVMLFYFWGTTILLEIVKLSVNNGLLLG
ncbi:hypothetical protein [Flavobacterium sp. FlaQc-48]|uniref:hypothetical protein n=1 Tax=Flavobacterium sp. FlaQc-48 TaxID=3374181 RepID=UPI003756B7A7